MQRPLLLIACVFAFLVVAALFVTRTVQFNNTHFRVGSIPPEIVNQLLPKTIPLSAMRPPSLRASDPIRFGNATSLVSIIEYGDYQCEHCRAMDPEIKKVTEKYDGRVRFVWRDFPIEEIHSDAIPAAIFARCAGLQGKYWEAYDELMKRTSLGESAYRQITDRLRLDSRLMNACRDNPDVEALIRRDVSEARADGVKSAPFIFVGTQAFEGFTDAATMERAVEAMLTQ